MEKHQTTIERAIADLKRDPNAYHASVAHLCSVVSTWSYSHTQALKMVLGRSSWWGSRKFSVEHFEVRNPAIFVDANAYLIGFGPVGEAELHVLVFRGTDPTNAVDWFTDALVEPHIYTADQWVHRGFYLSVDVLWPELRSRLRTLQGRLIITGHSLGGGMAAIASRRFLDECSISDDCGLKLCGTYTYGQPMVGNEAFGGACDFSHLYRHIFNGDVVSRLPPTFAEGYRHYGIALKPGPEGSSPDIASAASSDWPTPCILTDFVPASLSLLTARSPFLKELLEPVALVSGLPGSVRGWLNQIVKLRWPENNPACSIDDHNPTHYVDVSRISAQEFGESADPRKKVLRWISHSG